MSRTLYILLYPFYLGQGAVVQSTPQRMTRGPSSKDFCKLSPILQLETQDEISLDIPKSSCDIWGNQKLLKDGSALTCRLDPVGDKMEPKAQGYVLEGGVYRQGQSILDKEFMVYCCAGQLTLERGRNCKGEEGHREEEEQSHSSCPSSRYWVYYASDQAEKQPENGGRPAEKAPQSPQLWDALHTSLTNTTIKAPCVKISSLQKSSGGFSDRFIADSPCGDQDMVIRFDKIKGKYHAYLSYKPAEAAGWHYKLNHGWMTFSKNDGVRITGCCSWEIDGYNMVGSKSITVFQKAEKSGHADRVSSHLLSWTDNLSEVIGIEKCTDYGRY